MDWIDMAQDRDQWRALVNTVMNLRGSIKCWEVLEYLHNWQLLKKGSAPWVSDHMFSVTVGMGQYRYLDSGKLQNVATNLTNIVVLAFLEHDGLLVKTFPTFMIPRQFTIVVTKARNWTLPWTISVKLTNPHPCSISHKLQSLGRSRQRIHRSLRLSVTIKARMAKLCPCQSITPLKYGGKAFLTLGIWWRWMVRHAVAALPPGKQPPVHNGQKACWAPETDWTWWQIEEFLHLPRNELIAVRLPSYLSSSNITWALLRVKGRQFHAQPWIWRTVHHAVLQKNSLNMAWTERFHSRKDDTSLSTVRALLLPLRSVAQAKAGLYNVQCFPLQQILVTKLI
jgi:hypothetical protein